MEDESEKGETLHDDENTAMEDLAKALQQRDRPQDELRGFQENRDNANMEVNNYRDKLNTAAIELYNCREGPDTAFIELNNCQHLLASARRGLEDVDRKTVELKATDAHDRTRSHRDRCRRATKYMTVEGEINESLGKLASSSMALREPLSCGVPDRECNEAKYLQEALNMIEEFHRRGSRRGSSSKNVEIPLVERQLG